MRGKEGGSAGGVDGGESGDQQKCKRRGKGLARVWNVIISIEEGTSRIKTPRPAKQKEEKIGSIAIP